MEKEYIQSGFALISALVVLALVTSVTVATVSAQKKNIETVTHIIRDNQLKYHGDAVLLWASGVLKKDWKENRIDSYQDRWHQGLIDVEIENGVVRAEIHDLQSQFNLNSLAMAGEPGELVRSRFRRLLYNLDVDKDFTDAIADWIDKDNEARYPNGAEDDYYLELDGNSYRSANQPFKSKTELLLVKGVDRNDYIKLAPHINAVPLGTGININTAGEQVIKTLSDTMDAFAIEQLISLRAGLPFTSLANSSQGNQDPETENLQSNISNVSEQTSTNSISPVTNVNTSNQANQSGFTKSSADIRLPGDIYVNRWNASESIQLQSNEINNSQTNTVNNDENAQSDNDVDVSLAETDLVDQYDLDMTQLTVFSNYFEVNATIEQHGNSLEVSYVLFRDNNTGDIRTLYRKYNGVLYE